MSQAVIKTAYVNENHEFDRSKLSDEVKQQLGLLDKSQSLIMTIVAGTLMRYKSLDIQKQQILCKALCPEAFEPECQPNILQIQAVSSLIILYALFEFYEQSQNLLQKAHENGTATAEQKLDLTLSEIIILVGLIRFVQLVNSGEEVQEEDLSMEEIKALELEEPDIP